MFAKRFQKHFLTIAVIMVLFCVSFVFVDSAMAQVTTGAEEVGAAAGFDTDRSLTAIIGQIIKAILGFLGVIALGIVLYAGFLYMTSGGNQEKVETAKKWLINGAIGLALIFSAYAITTFIFSRLSEATGAGAGVETAGGGLPGDGYFPAGASSTFIVKAVAPQGAGAPVNTVIKIAFSKPVNAATITDKNIQVVDDATGSVVAGKLEVYGEKKDKVKFTPSAACPDEACGLPAQAGKEGCFDKNKKYKITLKAGAIKSNTGAFGLSCALGSKCTATFTTGEKCDAAAPSVYFAEPIDGGKVSQNKLVDISIKAEDDAGVSGLHLFIDGKSFGHEEPEGELTPLTFGAYFAWDTEGVKGGAHTLKAVAEDVNDHATSKEIKVFVLPEYCFDPQGNLQCDADGKQPECGACDGKSCTKNEDCSGLCVKSCDKNKNKACDKDADCLPAQAGGEGGKCVGQCVSEPMITDIAPKAAGPGSLVTIAGVGFLNYQSGDKKGQVYFSGKDDKGNPTYIKADLGCNAVSAWNNNQIIAKVPTGAVTGPIKVENYLAKFDTTDDKDGWNGDFAFTAKDVYPGLCAVQKENCTPNCVGNVCQLCNAAAVNEKVKAVGNNFGTKGENDFVFFGAIPAGFGAGFSWKAESVSGLEVPLVKSGKFNVAVSKGKKCANTETGEICTPKAEDKKCVCKDIYSNPIAFSVLPVESLPKIDSLAPLPAKIGQMVTIKGLNFGVNVGHVEIAREIGGQPYEWAAGLGCGPEAWAENEIIIKIPEAIAATVAAIDGASVFGKDYKLLIYNAAGVSSAPFDFEITAGEPGPGICFLQPDNGPVGAAFNVAGENLGTEAGYAIKFANPGAVVKSVGDWAAKDKKLISNAVVPDKALTGDVYLESQDGKIKSNAVNFKVGSCTQNSCVKPLLCCDSGSCEAKCKEAVVYQPAEYMWVLSTGPLPKMLQVLERPCTVGVIPQSPSPAKSVEDACPNGKISATFNLPIDTATLRYNIEIRRCRNSDKPCDFTACATKDADACVYRQLKYISPNDLATPNLYVSCTVGGDAKAAECDPKKDQNCKCNGVGALTSGFGLVDSFGLDPFGSDLNAAVATDMNPGVVKKQMTSAGAALYNLFENTWYEVTIKGGKGGVNTGEKGKFLPADYVWKFKTKKDICVPDNLLMTPLVGLIKDLYGAGSEQKYTVSGQYECQEIALQSENWQWNDVKETDPEDRAFFAGYPCVNQTADAYICPVEKTGRKDIGYFKTTAKPGEAVKINYETPIGKPIEIEAKAVPQNGALKKVFDELSKKGFLEIRFSEPKVIGFYPNCQEACINANIGAEFNTRMDADSFTPGTVKLYSCASADCLQVQPVTLTANNLNYQYQEKLTGETWNNLVITLSEPFLKPNTYYRVTLMSGIKSFSQVKLAGLNYATVNAPKGLPAQAGDCADAVDNDLDGAADYSGGYIGKNETNGQITYACGCYDKAQNKFASYNKFETADACAKNGDAVFGCLNLLAGGDVVADAAELKQIKDSTIYIAPDKQCSSPQGFELGESAAFDSFSWTFKTKNDPNMCLPDRVTAEPAEYISSTMSEKIAYFALPFSKPDNCSVKGQALNPFYYDWAWSSTQPVVAQVSNAKTAQTDKAFCTDSCLSKGSAPYATACGNGTVEIGEECDDGNTAAGDGCGIKCLKEAVKNCSPAQLQSAEKTVCCGNGAVEPGEECDAGCEYKNGQGAACTPGADVKGCVCVSKEAVCTNGCQNAGVGKGFVCGNAVKEPGEDADYGKNNKNFGLDAKCLNIGSVYAGAETPAAICGNGLIEEGEECEALCKMPNGALCQAADPDCVCSIYNNPLCTDKCVWKGFPTCATGCQTSESCVSGDVGCVGKKSVTCDGGADCWGKKTVICDSALADKFNCALGGKFATDCLVDLVDGCEGGQRAVVCYAGEPGCQGEKNYDCAKCVDGFMEINKNCAVGDAACLAGAKEKISCAACEDGVLAWACKVGDEGCVNNKKSKACKAGEPGCACTGCCGNGIMEKYPGGKYTLENLIGADEECEAECKNAETKVGCTYGTANCVCTFPAGCSNKCVNLGSSFTYDSYCGNGQWEKGEDKVCECSLPAQAGDVGCLPGNNLKTGPMQVAVTISKIEDFLTQVGGQYVFEYNIVTKYIQGFTKVAAQIVDPALKQIQGAGQLMFKTNDPAIVEKFKDILPKVTDGVFGGEADEDKAKCDDLAKIDLDGSMPAYGAKDVCTNALIYVPLTAKANTSKIVAKLYEAAEDGACPNEIGRADGWLAVFGKIKNFIIKSGLAASWCPVDSAVSVAKDAGGKPILLVSPKAALKPKTQHKLEIDGLFNNCNQSVPAMALMFTTGGGICLVDNVSLTPASVLITKAKTVTNFQAVAKHGNQAIDALPGLYDWHWEWSVENSSIADYPVTCDWQGDNCVSTPTQPDFTSASAAVTAKAKNGTTTVTAEAVISVDKTGMTGPDTSVGGRTPGVAQYVVFLCDHLWSPTSDANWDTLNTQVDIGKYSTTYKIENNYNIGLFYCRDFGGPGFADDLPKVDIQSTDVINKDITPRFGVYFDKSFDYVRASSEALNALMSDPAKSWTIDTWLYNEDEPDDRYARVFYKNLGNSFADGKRVQLAVRRIDKKRSLILQINNGAINITVGTTAPNGLFDAGFKHVAVVYDGVLKSVKLYINGLEIPVNEISEPLNFWPANATEKVAKDDYASLYVGGLGKTDVPLASLGGYMDEFRIWGKALDKEQLNQLTKNIEFDPKTAIGLAAYWNFDADAKDFSHAFSSVANCSADYNESKCKDNKDFHNINLINLAIVKNLLPTDIEVDGASEEFKHECNDKADNDGNGLADEKDPKCSGPSDPWETPKLFAQYFFTRVAGDEANDNADDVISLRVYENIEGLPPEVWYQRYAPNPGQTTPVALDCQADDFGKFCYNGAKDGTTVYVAASNVAFGKEGKPPHNIYNNIYVLGFNAGANAATQNIYSQMVNTMLFNTNLLSSNNVLIKSALIRDTQRIEDMVMLNEYIKAYKATPPHNGAVPQLDAGSYERGRTFSVWPSWQKELGAALKKTLPTDPLNHFYWESATAEAAGVSCVSPDEPDTPVYCPSPATNYQCVVPGKFCVNCPAGYDKATCYNSTTLELAKVYDANVGQHPVYSFMADPEGTGNKTSYKLNFMFEIADETHVYKVSPAFGAPLSEVDPW